MFRLSITLGLFLGGCYKDDPYLCTTAAQCVLGSQQGTCEPTGACSFFDTACPSGRRYGTVSAGALASQCVPPDGGADAAMGDGPVGCGLPGQACCSGACAGDAPCVADRCQVCTDLQGSPCGDAVAATIGSAGGLGSWSHVTPFRGGRYGLASALHNGHAYVIGGQDAQVLSDVQVATLDTAGLGPWSDTTPLPTPTAYHSSAVSGDFLYVLGGANSASTLVDDVWVAAIRPDGTLGGWVSPHALPIGRAYHASAAYENHLYVLGGTAPGHTTLSDVLSATVNPDGTIGPWVTGPPLPVPREGLAAFIVGQRVYVTGGRSQAGGTYLADVIYSAIASDGSLGPWTMTSSFAIPRAFHQSVTGAGYVYVVGGFGGQGASIKLADVQVARLNPDGTLAAWSSTTALPMGRDSMGLLSLGSTIYALGGVGF